MSTDHLIVIPMNQKAFEDELDQTKNIAHINGLNVDVRKRVKRKRICLEVNPKCHPGDEWVRRVSIGRLNSHFPLVTPKPPGNTR